MLNVILRKEIIFIFYGIKKRHMNKSYNANNFYRSSPDNWKFKVNWNFQTVEKC